MRWLYMEMYEERVSVQGLCKSWSWFDNFHLTLKEIVKLTYCCITPGRKVRLELKNTCEETVVDWYNFCREVCSEVIENENVKIGGPGKAVEIDESKNITRARERTAFGSSAESRGTQNCF